MYGACLWLHNAEIIPWDENVSGVLQQWESPLKNISGNYSCRVLVKWCIHGLFTKHKCWPMKLSKQPTFSQIHSAVCQARRVAVKHTTLSFSNCWSTVCSLAKYCIANFCLGQGFLVITFHWGSCLPCLHNKGSDAAINTPSARINVCIL